MNEKIEWNKVGMWLALIGALVGVYASTAQDRLMFKVAVWQLMCALVILIADWYCAKRKSR